jgi:hypothetical protein
MSLFNHYFNIAKKDSLLNEGVSKYENLNYDYSLNKKVNFFDMIYNIHVIKKIFDYLNKELQQLNEEDKGQRKKLNLEAYYFWGRTQNLKEIEKNINDFFEDKINFFELKKLTYQELINEKIITVKNVKENNFENVIDLIQNISISFNYQGKDIASDYSVFNLKDSNYKETITTAFHDIMHLFYDDKSLDRFYDQDIEFDDEYDFDSPIKYSPEEILHEFASLSSAPYTFSYDLFKERLFDDKEEIKRFINQNKKMINSYYSDKFINDFFIKVKKIEINKNQGIEFSFSIEQFKFIKKIYEMMGDKETAKKYEDIIRGISRNFSYPASDYDFFTNAINSIKDKINKNKKVTWKLFRSFFKNYPNLIKLFSDKKYPDNLEIIKTPNYENLNNFLSKVYNASSDLMIKYDSENKIISNPEKRISSLFKKIGEIIKKHSLISHQSEIKLITGLLKK